MIVKNKEERGIDVRFIKNHTGGLIIPCDDDGSFVLQLPQIDKMVMGAKHIQSRHNGNLSGANLLIKEGKTKYFFNADLSRVKKAMQEAFRGKLVDCTSFLSPVNPAKQPYIKPLHKSGTTLNYKGIYLGVWHPKDNEGKSLGHIFDIYAAPQDLTHMNGRKYPVSYNATIQKIAEKVNWHGHDGTFIENEDDIYDLINQQQFEKLEKWFLPPLEILRGINKDVGRHVQDDNLYTNRNKGDFRSTFQDTAFPLSAKEYYLTCTFNSFTKGRVYAVNFINGKFESANRLGPKCSARPIRLELRR